MENIVEIRESPERFSPQHTFSSGQTFRFYPEGNTWTGVAMGALVRIREENGQIVLKMQGGSRTREDWRAYFDLDRDYTVLFPDADPILQRALAAAPGLRVLRQEPFETLISFIISANNNIPRIRGIIRALCREAGTPFTADGETWHAFPSPEQLGAVPEKRLRELGCGYRAPYIAATAQLAVGTDFSSAGRRETADLLSRLQAFPGVGPKVARCAALFGFGCLDAFPADVWIIRALRELYGFEGSPAQADAFSRRKFGPYAGIAQQYLYYCMRSRNHSFAAAGGV